jgi:hypothetical protein
MVLLAELLGALVSDTLWLLQYQRNIDTYPR